MKGIYLFKKIKKNNGSLLLGSTASALLMLMCLFLLSATTYHRIHFLTLEKEHRIGKILIHHVWQDIRHNPKNYIQKKVNFNVGYVFIDKKEQSIILKSQLHSGTTIQQIFSIPPFE